MNMQQMALGLSVKDDTTLANYVSGTNQELLAVLNTMASGRGEKYLYLFGKNGVGRTHLLQASCFQSSQLGLTTLYLPLGDLTHLEPDILEGLEQIHLVCVDDVNGIAGKDAWEEAFFDFFNRMRESGHRLIVAGNAMPQKLNIKLQDLVSRLTNGPIYQVYDLDDDQKIDAVILRAKSRGILLTKEVAQFLFNHFPRDMSSLFTMLSQLERASLEAKRKITIPFIKSVLKLK